MPQQRVVIRKYENRRLYDTARSRYVNLEEVAEMVREGVDVQVVDARTGEDLTRVVLTQIIVDDAKGQESALPLDFLRQLVMASGRATQEGFAGYMKTVFDTYQQAYDTFQKTLRDTSAVSLAPLNFLHSVFGPQQQDAAAAQAHTAEPEELSKNPGDTPARARKPNIRRRQPGLSPASSTSPAAGAPESSITPADLPALLHRIEELERRLGEASRAPRPRRVARPGP